MLYLIKSARNAYNWGVSVDVHIRIQRLHIVACVNETLAG